MTNHERQRLFQERHPGYDRLRKARRRLASLNALCGAWIAHQAALALAERMMTRPQLALPAPVVIPVIPGLNTIEAVRAPATSSISS
jgi:hypothetical protein